LDIYKVFAEDENETFIFLFTYKPSTEEVLFKLGSLIECEPHIYDIFPEPNQETVVLDDILSVITEDGKEMFIPQGLSVNFFSVSRILFGRTDDPAHQS
jgi:hypothetical protein